MKAIETKKLTKYYGKSRGIIDVDLSVETGDFFGFVGPNGAGKSTFIRTLLGLISPTAGAAFVFGKDITTAREEILSEIGYLPSETVLYSGMRVNDVLSFSASLRKKDCKNEARQLCERLELDPARKIDELSFGNRKKVGIVCALQHSPKLYVLDEPTSGLDPLMQREFYAILKERNEEGATVFLSSHILSEVARYCENAAVIRDGRILVSDRVSRLGHTGVKRVVLRGCTEKIGFSQARDVTAENDTVRFLYSGDPKMLLQKLSSIAFTDLNVSDPDLEEVFLHYYENKEV